METTGTASNNKTETTSANSSADTTATAQPSSSAPVQLLQRPTSPSPSPFQFPPRSHSPPHQTAAPKLQESNFLALTHIATNADFLGYIPQQNPNIKATTHPDQASKPSTFAFHTKGSQPVDRVVGLTKLLGAEVKDLFKRLGEEEDKEVREGDLEKIVREVVPRLGGLNGTVAVEVGRVSENGDEEVKFQGT